MAWFVYMLRCADDSLYTGVTNNLDGRVHAHNTSKQGARYTRSRRPVCLVYSERKRDKRSAMRREAALKKLTRSEKISLIVHV
jgi:putative endonuclease